MEPEKKRRLAAIMFTDIVGYTTMIEQNEAEAVRYVQRHQHILEACTEQYRGEILQYYGDGSLTLFSSASEAVRCAVSMQQRFQQDPKLPLRIGIHLGEVRFEGDKLFGSGVNIASRLEGLGVAGSVIISKKVRQEIKNQDNIFTQYLGFFQLKNIEDPVEIFALEGEGLTIPQTGQIDGKAKLLNEKSNRENQPKLIRNTTRILAGLGTIALLFTLSSLYINIWKKSEDPAGSYQLDPITNTIWLEGTGNWAPDGNRFTFSSVKNGNCDIFVRHKTGGEAIQLTDSPFDEVYPRWSTDGSVIAYTSTRPDGTNIYLVPSTGGLERKIAETFVSGIETNVWINFLLGVAPWSPDGTELLYSQIRPNGAIGISKKNIKTGEEISITHPSSDQIDFCASWAPDGTSIIYQRNGNLWTKNLLEEQEEKLLLPDKQILYPAYSADRSKVVFVHKGNAWELDLSSLALRQLTSGIKRIFSLAPIPGGGLSVDDFRHQTDLRRLNLERKQEKGYADEQLTFYNGDNFYGQFSPDGNQILYHSSRTGNREIWLMDLENEKREINLTEHPEKDFCGDWSPDGEQIAFFSDREDGYKVWIMDKDGNILQKASDTLVQLAPIPFAWPHQLRWSPEGGKIAYMALSDQGHSMWVVDLNTQQAEPLIHGVYTFVWYQTDDIIICNRKNSAQIHATDLVAVNIKTGKETILRKNMPVTEMFASRDGRWLGFTSAIGHMSYNLYRIKLNPPRNTEYGLPTLNGEPEQLTFAAPWHTHNGCFSPDGKSIIYTLEADEMDVYLVEGYQ